MTNENQFLSYDDNQIDIPKLICNAIYSGKNNDLVWELSSNWREYQIKNLKREFYEVNTSKDYWRKLMADYNGERESKDGLSRLILEYDKEKRSEYLLCLYSCETFILTNIEYESSSAKTIKRKDVDIIDFGTAFIWKLASIDTLKMNNYLDFQLKSNFDEDITEYVAFLNALIFQYETADEFLEIGQVKAVKLYIEKKEIENNKMKPQTNVDDFLKKQLQELRTKIDSSEMENSNIKIVSLTNENDFLKKQIQELKEKNTELSLKVNNSETQINSLGWVGHKNPARVHYLKFLIRHYFDDGFITNEKLSKVFMIILQNEIYTPKNQFLPILSTSYFKGRKNSIEENKGYILNLINSITTTSRNKKILDKKKIEKEQLISAFEDYWNNTKQS